jgi:benzoate-CoA ligase family protein
VANAVCALLDDRIADGDGARTAIVTPSGVATYADLLALAARFGHALHARGVEPEHRVAILLPDGLAWAGAFLGALRIGAVAVPLNTRLGPERWAAMLDDSRARLLVTDATRATALAPLRAALPWLHGVLTPPEVSDAPTVLAPEPVGDEDMAFWLYTSGTTGAPKAAVHLHRDCLAGGGYADGVLGVSSGDRIFSTSALFFAYALGNALLIPLARRARSWLDSAWADPAMVAHVLATFAPTLFFSVPTLYARLLRAELPPDSFRPVRLAISAGERLPAEIAIAWRERFGVEILDGIGATETIFMVLSNRPGQSRPGSTGTPVPGTEARLLDADGHEVPDGTEGVLHVRTPSASPFYWRRGAESRRVFVGEWFRTGDVYVRDADGFFQHRGREDDLFKVAGMWVSPADVEGTLLGHPGVADAGVVGAASADGLVKAFAFVVPRAGAAGSLAAELRDRCARELQPHQRPREVLLVDELPRTATGKLQRFVLRDRLRA